MFFSQKRLFLNTHLSSSININSLDHNNLTLLNHAVCNEDINQIEQLLLSGAIIDVENSKLNNKFYSYFKCNSPSSININSLDHNNLTLLNHAVCNEDINQIEQLLLSGAIIDVENSKLNNKFYSYFKCNSPSSSHRNKKIFKLLHHHDEDKHITILTFSFYQQVLNNNIFQVKQLLKNNPWLATSKLTINQYVISESITKDMILLLLPYYNKHCSNHLFSQVDINFIHILVYHGYTFNHSIKSIITPNKLKVYNTHRNLYIQQVKNISYHNYIHLFHKDCISLFITYI